LKGGDTVINLTVVAKELGVSKMTLWRWKEKGMPCEQIGNVWKVKSVDQVKEWLVSQRKGD
jgi:phage terminase Nu1 subunit (DNA packaging protein)